MPRQMDHRPEDLRSELFGVAHKRGEKPLPGAAVRTAETIGCGRNGPLQDR